MSQNDRHDEDQSERVAALEAEVAALKHKLAQSQSASGDADDPADPADPHAPADASADGDPPQSFTGSRPKMVVVGGLIAGVVMAVIFILFSALSSGFNSFAHKAAAIFVPDEAAESAAPAPTESSEADEAGDGRGDPGQQAFPRAPGL